MLVEPWVHRGLSNQALQNPIKEDRSNLTRDSQSKISARRPDSKIGLGTPYTTTALPRPETKLHFAARNLDTNTVLPLSNR
ncbi:hypothetical protein V6N11_032179 [Hibiscus sabdariffa]|uniref:Uncharacterized protein n=1 Tax=Hibiscus sabdariffa TaxID=183260 RepID=A0ABR2T053_9ROSI